MVRRPPPERTRRSIALTGACSFLGKNLVGMLEEDESVSRIVALDVARPVSGGPKTRLYELDLTLPTADERVAEILAAESVDTLVHMAFLSSPTSNAAWAHELESVGTMHLLNGARQAPPKHLVLWSQTWLYGAKPSNPNFLTEDYPLAADPREPYFADKIAAEREVARYAIQKPETTVTVLRMAPIVGPTANNFMTRYLRQRLALTLLGFDPLWQFVHEVDAVAAVKLSIDQRLPGIFNIVGDDVLPLSKILRLSGSMAAPLLHPLARPFATLMWTAQLGPWPPGFLPHLRYVCAADGTHAADVLGFRPAYSSQDALMDFVTAQRLRDARLARRIEA
jgi:UDP-glucose 4-epimerase